MSSLIKGGIGKVKGGGSKVKDKLPFRHSFTSKTGIKGLDKFVGEIRQCSTVEQEEARIRVELAKIRKLFVEKKKIEGYDKKKSVSKLLYIHMLGYDVDVGYREAIDLMSSYKFSEKQVAYITIGALLSEEHPMTPLTIQAMRTDLNAAGDTSDVVRCLALSTIANIGGRQLAEGLMKEVQGLLLSRSSSSMVQKKAALCLLQMFRATPDFLTADPWADRFNDLLANVKDMGVLCSVMSLLLEAVRLDPDGFAPCRRVVLVIFAKIVLQGDYPRDYLYNSVPHPWMQIKLIQFLQHYPPPTNKSHYTKLMEILNRILSTATKVDDRMSVNQRNAVHTVLFEAMKLVIHLDCNAKLLNKTAKILARSISAKEANVQYLGLDTMANLATIVGPESTAVIRRHHQTVIKALHNPDVSIRRRALKLLYEMCDKDTSNIIVREMLHYLTAAEVDIREELVIKIAILAEKFAPEYMWYVDTIMRLINLAGQDVSDEIWFNVVRVVSSNPDVQKYAAKRVFEALQDSRCPEVTVKVGGYVLGEFGDRISEEPGFGPKDQFEALYSNYTKSSRPTKALLLTTFVKFLNIYKKELDMPVMRVLAENLTTDDVDMQQRACEYTKLYQLENDALMKFVLDRMPALEEVAAEEYVNSDRVSEREYRRRPESSPSMPAKQVVVDGEDDEEEHERSRRLETPTPYDRPRSPRDHVQALGQPTPIVQALDAGGGSTAKSTPFGTASSPPVTASPPASGGTTSTPFGNTPSMVAAPSVTPEIREGGDILPRSARPTAEHIKQLFNNLCVAKSGVLYEDENLQIGMKMDFQRGLGRLLLFYGNRSGNDITALSTVITPVSYLTMQMQELDPVIPSGAQVQQLIRVTCLREFQDAPTMQISFLHGGKSENLMLRLPVVLTKFIEPTVLDGDTYLESWRQMSGAPKEHKSVFRAATPINVAELARVITDSFGMSVLHGIDTNKQNIVASGTLYTTAGVVPILLRCETNLSANVMRLTIRSGSGQVTAAVNNIVSTKLMS